ncbi:MAG: LacI family DNA-binding transcriptional regulator [Firmicutes bacterium]|nr:LacI family DNA-binding transcriptional regulator [Bacillota bacterium]
MKTQKPRLTIYDIARDMGLSPSTISKILHHTGKVGDATRKRVLDYVKATGYVANFNARILKAKHSWTIGVVFSDIASFGFEHPFFGSVLQAFKNYVEVKGYELVFIVKKLGQSELTYYEWCQNKSVDGVLILTGDLNDPSIIELVNSGIPCVSADIIMPNLYSAMSDDKMGITISFTHLLDIGCRDIAAFSGPTSSRAYAERTLAYRNLLVKHNTPFIESWYHDCDGYGVQNAYSQAITWIASWKQKPQAIIAFSDDLAMGLINALKVNKIRVPEDISVIGYDDIAFASLFNPPLTTIRQNKVAIAEAAADALLSLINGNGDILEKPTIIQRIPVQLIIRESTKK